MTHIHVIHENAGWLGLLARALDAERLAWRDWFLDQGTFDLSQPPQGVFYNRMSASSHTRRSSLRGRIERCCTCLAGRTWPSHH